MTPEQSRLALVQLYGETIAALGTAGWSEIGAMSAEDCRLPNGSSGANFAATQLGPASTDPDADIRIVEALWKSKGIMTTTKRSTNPANTMIRLVGVGGPADIIEFGAAPERTALTGDSVCVIGDPVDIITTNVTGGSAPIQRSDTPDW